MALLFYILAVQKCQSYNHRLIKKIIVILKKKPKLAKKQQDEYKSAEVSGSF